VPTKDVKLAEITCHRPLRGSEVELLDLIESMDKVGQLQEILLNSKKEIIAGRRRVEAARALKWDTIRAIVDPSLDDAARALKAERDENTCRVEMTKAERVELAHKLLELERPKAQGRQQAGAAQTNAQLGRSSGDASGNLPEASPRGETRQIASAAVGISPRTIQKISDIKKASEQPGGQARYGDLAERTKKDGEAIDPLHKEFKKRQEIYAAAAEQPGIYGKLAERLKKEDTFTVHRDFQKKVKEGTTKGEELLDQVGKPIPSHLRDLFGDRWLAQTAEAVEELSRDAIRVITDRVTKKGPAYKHLLCGDILKLLGEAAEALEIVHSHLTRGKPHAVHQACESKGCKDCRQSGWLPIDRYKELKSEGKA
jgi:ParB family chromosome partitioning protein